MSNPMPAASAATAELLSGRSRILVTGGAGFIGSNLTLELQSRHPQARIVVVDDFRSGDFKNLRGFRGDCRFSTWMYRVTCSVCLTELARRGRRGEVQRQRSQYSQVGPRNRQRSPLAPLPRPRGGRGGSQ